ncbi:KH domain-containing protein [Candidatus Daviesbacteria bacterium]|nr:KH domain-containing protein [Candidatus Daviesbacteria bacterium]
MEEKLSEVLDNILGLLLLEGSYEIEEDENGLHVLIETKDAGRLIGSGGQSLDGLQLIVNQMVSRKMAEGDYKRVILDVGGWRKQKEEELSASAKAWVKQVLDSGKELELEPMSPWQRRIVHMVVQETKGVESESVGEGRDRHIIIKLKTQKPVPSEATPEAGEVEGSNVKTGKD